jgi:putative MATE family efflux protein
MDRTHDREIVRLAVPAFLALVAEPLFLLADSAIVGHLGTTQLAGLGIAGVVLQTIVGVCVFLAYGTTASVARRVGAGDLRGAVTQGVDGLWLAAVIGVLVTIPCLLAARPLVRAVGAHGEVVDQGTTYLRLAVLGITPLLLMMAATGVLRGLQDTRTPMVVAVAGNLVNIVLNLLLVYGFGSFDGWGIGGSAIGSVIAQALSAATLVAVVVRGARRLRAPLRPDVPGIRQAARAGVALVVRTLTLRAALLVTTYAVTLISRSDQDAQLAAHQIAFTVWTFLQFVLDAIAIAAQALTGRSLGAGDIAGTRAITARMVWWGVVCGMVMGVLVAAASPFLGALFTGDDAVSDLLVPVLLIVAVAQPVCGIVFVLDGVLIGAGDGRYLAYGGLLTLIAYAPVVLLLHPTLVVVWVSFAAVFMGARLVVLVHRARGTSWLVVGASA